MAAQQVEFVAFKAEVAASEASVAVSIAKLEEVATKANADAAAANAVIVELQKSYSQISFQAVPWFAAIQAEVAASEAKATGALFLRLEHSMKLLNQKWRIFEGELPRWKGRAAGTRNRSGKCPVPKIWSRVHLAPKRISGLSSAKTLWTSRMRYIQA